MGATAGQTPQTVKSGKRVNLLCQNSLQQQVLAGHNITFSTTQCFQYCDLQFTVPAQLESTQTQTEQQSLKVYFRSLGIQRTTTSTTTLKNEMQLQLCTKDEANQQADNVYSKPRTQQLRTFGNR